MPVVRVIWTPPTVTVAVACIVSVPATDETDVTVHEPPESVQVLPPVKFPTCAPT